MEMDVKGLSSKEAKSLLLKYGYNEISLKEESWLHRLFRRFWGPIPWMIEVGVILSGMAQRWEDFSVILSMLLINAFVDFYQESKALNAIAILKKKLAPMATVFRDEEYKQISAKELVRGDIVKIKIGDIVPADVELLGGSDFIKADMAALTGESLPVNKLKGDILYANAIIKQGEMIAKVDKTGSDTYFGKTVGLVAKAQEEEQSHFQKMVFKVGNFLIVGTLFIIAFIIAIGIYRGEDILNLLIFSLVLTIAAIPVAMPAVLTVTMALGSKVLATKDVIVSRLAAIEELAGMDVLCSDKTGTLTQNKMSLAKPYIDDKYDEKELFLYAALASKKENNDPIEKPIFDFISENGLNEDILKYKINKFVPFDPVSKKTQGIDENKIIYIKGAPQVILEECNDENFDKTKAYDAIDDFANKGFRTLGVAYKKPTQEEYNFIGLIPLYDPPREDSKEAILLAHKNKISVKMITGDNTAVARYISTTLGIGTNIQSMKEFKKDELEAVQIIENSNGFAEVFPEDKFFIVDQLQKANHIVGMTGDGVNDAPALKKADCGIAVSGATDAARASADIVIMSSGLSVIIDAIEQARIIFERMKSYVIYRITETIRLVLFIALAIAGFNFYPITSIMIIILALLNDVPIMTIAYDNTKKNKKPVKWDMKEVFVLSSLLGLAGVISSFATFYIIMVFVKTHPNGMVLLSELPSLFSTLLNIHQNSIQILPSLPSSIDVSDTKSFLGFAQSAFFMKLIIAGHATIYNTRARSWFFKKPYPSYILLLASFVTALIGVLISVYGFNIVTPIGWSWAIFMSIFAVIFFVFNDVMKILVLKFLHKAHS